MSDDNLDSSDDDKFRVSEDSYVLGNNKANERLDQLTYILSKKDMTFTDNLLKPPPINAIDLSDSGESDKQPPYMDRMADWDFKRLQPPA